MIYCYEDSEGRIYEENFPMGEAPSEIDTPTGKAARSYYAEQCGRRELRGAASGGWPMELWAGGVHPVDADKAAEFDASHGVPTEYNKQTGCPVMTSPSHRRKYMKLHGWVDLDSFY